MDLSPFGKEAKPVSVHFDHHLSPYGNWKEAKPVSFDLDPLGNWKEAKPVRMAEELNP